jgi:glycosyltransferase involved in cell wall biosynthesis
MRYIWDQAPHYFGKTLPLAYPLLKMLRVWDKAGSAGVNLFVPISKFVAARIRKFYGRRSEVIYPAVNTDWITPREEGKRGEFFLYAGAMVPYKRVDLIVAACSKLNLPLVVAGTPSKQLKELAGSSVKFIGKVNNQELAKLYRDCRALIFPAKEDFGMIPIECMAAGRPVIGLGAGGLKETSIGIRPSQPFSKEATGVFINDSKDKLSALIDAIKYFETIEDEFLAESCIRQAQKFSPDVFFNAWHELAKRYGFSEQSGH